MSAYKYLSKAWARPQTEVLGASIKDLMKEALVKWRKQPSVIRVTKPTRIDKARRLGYKAKPGFIVVRVRIRKGGARKARPRSGRRPKAMGVTKYTRAKSLRKIAQERAARKYVNLTPLNSYFVWEDGKHAWFEVLMVDPNHPTVKSDGNLPMPKAS
jgi:large subunit ribosomal protein L15e